METTLLEAKKRINTEKSETKKLRRDGRIPGVLYSKNIEPVSIDVAENSLKPLVFTAKAHLIALKMEGLTDQECIIKEVQFDPVTDKIIHFDLIGLTKGEKLEIDVPVQLKGSAVGIKEGGVLQHPLHKLTIRCFPKDIPQYLEIDVSNLSIGDAVHVSDLVYENIEILNPKEAVIASVVHPKIEAEPVAPVEGVEGVEAPAEPEVIGKGKADKEEEEQEET
jgi:large subunit ribosomal protein L25